MYPRCTTFTMLETHLPRGNGKGVGMLVALPTLAMHLVHRIDRHRDDMALSCQIKLQACPDRFSKAGRLPIKC